MKVLVTGFEPFGGATINPALEAVRRLPREVAGAEVVTVQIPVVFGKGPADQALWLLKRVKICEPMAMRQAPRTVTKAPTKPTKFRASLAK